MTIDPRAVAEEFYAGIQEAWNAADGAAFGAAFAADASFVNIRGEAHDGAAAIAAGHQAIFASVYRGSAVNYVVDVAMALGEAVVVARGRAVLDVPAGPLAGTHRAVSSVVLRLADGAWAAVAFHNTLVTA